ncbi:9467_t:CDS:2 [Funneliformis geosporum]|uniref:9467_t:CDS:1 n=1 Tax=Funneliformis geosporum TaxID=1117311 RepID=A0A9W4X3V4_9GLOM|nr:9467_t:CDS:2 [Funneliformis geosporum]
MVSHKFIYLITIYIITTLALHKFLNVIIFTDAQERTFSPEARYAHTSTLVGTKLFFFGGLIRLESNASIIVSTNDVFYLELSQPFNTMSPPWIKLSDISPLPVRLSWATSSYGGANNSMIFIFGGTMQSIKPAQDLDSNGLLLLPDFKHLIYSFDTQSFQWSIPIISGDEPYRRRELSAVTNDRGKIHFFGGKADKYTGSSTEGDFNEINVLDSLTLNWELGTLDGAPNPRDGHTATILNNGLIVFIGGREMVGPDKDLRLVNMRAIDVYDTKKAEWYFMQAAGPLVEGRILHSAVLSEQKYYLFNQDSPLFRS